MTLEKNISKLFGLKGDTWLKHANPISVWTRFVILPLLAFAIWSRAWIGWLSLIPVAILFAWAVINPLVFKKPKSTKSWASKCVLGEMVLVNRSQVPIPPHHLNAKNSLTLIQALGSLALIYGLYTFHFWLTIVGVILVYLGKMWFLDRMVWLFEEMKGHEEYRGFLY